MKPLLLSLFLIAPLCAQTVDVTKYGALPDGHTDSTAAIEKAFKAAPAGSTIQFPCGASGKYYIVTQPLVFPGFTTIAGSHGYSCRIEYQSNSYNEAAFSFVNVAMVTMRDLGLISSSKGVSPATIVTLGGSKGATGQNIFENVTVGGYATKAAIYSIASENNVYNHLYLTFLGGGGDIGFYTSAKDDLGICSACQTNSNLSLTMNGPIFANSVSTPYTAVVDKTEGGTGDHVYRDGYIGSGDNPASTGFTFISGDSSHGGPNGHILVTGFRIENGGYAFTFLRDYQNSIYNLNISDVTWDSTATGAVAFMQGGDGLTLTNCRFVKNIGENHSPNASSSVFALQNSTMTEDYGPVTIRNKAVGNYFLMVGKGSIILPTGTPGTSNIVLQPNH